MPVILDATSGVRGLLINLDTGQPIRKVKRAIIPDSPMEQGEFEAFRMGPDGKECFADGKPVTYRGKCRMRFIPTANLTAKTSVRPRRLIPKPMKRRRKAERLTVPLLDMRCQHYACNRLADWIVSDEVETQPIIVGNRKYPRAEVVARRYYCHWHYEPARILDAKGDVVEILDNLKARPD